MAVRSKRHAALDRNENLAGYCFIIPSFIGFIVFSIFPLIFTAVLSFTKWDMISGFSNIQFIGVDNYINLTSDAAFLESLKNNIVFMLLTVPLSIFLGLLMAILINKHCFGKGAFKILFFLPYISSTVAVAVVWMVIFHPSYGPVNEFLRSIGVSDPPKWLGDTHWSLFTIAMMYVWQGLGYSIIIYIAGLQGISQELYEASEIDGANWFQKQKAITIPMITPTTFFLLITGLINTFKVFDQIQILTEGGPGSSSSVLVYFLYREAFRFSKIGYGSSVAMILFIIVFIITFLQWQGQKKWVNYV